MIEIAICAVAHSDIGTGHVRRMLTLAEVLLENPNVNVTLLTSDLGRNVASSKDLARLSVQIRGINSTQVGDFLSNTSFDAVILDNYFWDRHSESKLRSVVRTICIVDDLADRHHDADLLLDQNAHHSAKSYDGLVPTSCTLLVGSDYCMLPKEFRSDEIIKHIPPSPTSNNPIFVSLGGGDPTNSLLRLVRLILENTAFSQTVATGSHIDDAAALSRLAKDNPDRLEVILDSKVVIDQMVRSKFAVAAGGTMTWERAVVGLPSLCLIVAGNQIASSNWLKSHAIHDVFDMRDSNWNEQTFLTALQSFSDNPEKLVEYRNNSKRLIKGDGAFRVAKALIDHIENLDVGKGGFAK